MAMLDRDGVYGAPRFHLAMKKLNIKAHIGAEITSLLPPYHKTGEAVTSRVPLLCASREGYQNLCRLVTRMKLRAPKYPAALPRHAKGALDNPLVLGSQAIASVNDLSEYSAGLVCLTGGDEGPLAHALAIGGSEAGRSTLEQLIAIYWRENVYVELRLEEDNV